MPLESRFNPYDFKIVADFYDGTLGRCEWETLAARAVKLGQENGHWVPLTDCKETDEAGVDGMVLLLSGRKWDNIYDCGVAVNTPEGLVFTDNAWAKVYKKYGVKKEPRSRV